MCFKKSIDEILFNKREGNAKNWMYKQMHSLLLLLEIGWRSFLLWEFSRIFLEMLC